MANQRDKDKRYISAWINKTLKQALRAEADSQGVNAGDIVTRLLEEHYSKTDNTLHASKTARKPGHSHGQGRRSRRPTNKGGSGPNGAQS